MNDIQFRKKDSKILFAFVSIEVKMSKLIFSVDEIKWNVETEQNETLRRFDLDASEFAKWAKNWIPCG